MRMVAKITLTVGLLAVIVDTSYGVHGIVSNQPYSHFVLLKPWRLVSACPA